MVPAAVAVEVDVGSLRGVLVDDPADDRVLVGAPGAQVEREHDSAEEDAHHDPRYQLEEQRLGRVSGGGAQVEDKEHYDGGHAYSPDQRRKEGPEPVACLGVVAGEVADDREGAQGLHDEDREGSQDRHQHVESEVRILAGGPEEAYYHHGDSGLDERRHVGRTVRGVRLAEAPADKALAADGVEVARGAVVEGLLLPYCCHRSR